MVVSPAEEALIARYLDGIASESDLAHLNTLLAQDAQAATRFALATRLDASLVEHFSEWQSAPPARQKVRTMRVGRSAAKPFQARLVAAGWLSAAAILIGMAMGT